MSVYVVSTKDRDGEVVGVCGVGGVEGRKAHLGDWVIRKTKFEEWGGHPWGE